MKLKEMINEKKFKKDMLDFLGFNDAGGTFLKEQYGDGSWHKIKKSFLNDIICILDNCREETVLDVVKDEDMVLMVFTKEDAKKIRKIASLMGLAWVERI
ncbi:MAG: hypothetical protein ACP5N7_00535 [Candidatus Pacearchaeota archaeon]